MKMLHVFDARAAIGGAVVFFQARVEIENRADRVIADGVDRKLESGFVGGAHLAVKLFHVEKIGTRESAFDGLFANGSSIHAVSEPSAPSAKAFRLPMRRSELPNGATMPGSAYIFQSRTRTP